MAHEMERITASTQKQAPGSRKTRQRINSGREKCLQSLIFSILVYEVRRRFPFIHHWDIHRPNGCCRDWAYDTMRWSGGKQPPHFLTLTAHNLSESAQEGWIDVGTAIGSFVLHSSCKRRKTVKGFLVSLVWSLDIIKDKDEADDATERDCLQQLAAYVATYTFAKELSDKWWDLSCCLMNKKSKHRTQFQWSKKQRVDNPPGACTVNFLHNI